MTEYTHAQVLYRVNLPRLMAAATDTSKVTTVLTAIETALVTAPQ